MNYCGHCKFFSYGYCIQLQIPVNSDDPICENRFEPERDLNDDYWYYDGYNDDDDDRYDDDDYYYG